MSSMESEIRKRLGGQLPPQSTFGGVRMLLYCNVHKGVWYQDGPHAYLDLTGERIGKLAAELGADLDHLPNATCRRCGVLGGPGEINLDGYATPSGKLYGVGISWETMSDAGKPIHLLVTTHNIATMQSLTRSGRMPRSGVITDFATCRAWLAWMQKLPYPSSGYHKITPHDSEEMAHMNRPGFGVDDSMVWQGGLWEVNCPPLGGRSMMNAALALPPDEELQLSNLLIILRTLCKTISEGRIAGEE